MREVPLELIFMTALILLPLIPAVVLFKVLPSTGEVSGPFRGMNVKFGGAFAAYLILFVCLLQIRPKDFDHYHTWRVDGKIQFQRAGNDPKPNPHEIRVRITPPELVVYADKGGGAFRFDVPVPMKNGQPDFPRLSLDLSGYEPVVLSLERDGQGDGSQVTAQHDEKNREITLGTITLRSSGLVDTYDEANAQVPVPQDGGAQ